MVLKIKNKNAAQLENAAFLFLQKNHFVGYNGLINVKPFSCLTSKLIRPHHFFQQWMRPVF